MKFILTSLTLGILVITVISMNVRDGNSKGSVEYQFYKCYNSSVCGKKDFPHMIEIFNKSATEEFARQSVAWYDDAFGISTFDNSLAFYNLHYDKFCCLRESEQKPQYDKLVSKYCEYWAKVCSDPTPKSKEECEDLSGGVTNFLGEVENMAKDGVCDMDVDMQEVRNTVERSKGGPKMPSFGG